MKKPVLQVHNLNYTYGGKPALSDVSIDIFEGERLVVMGSNGAGKSTLFLNLNGVLTPDSGQILYRGKAITRKELNELRKNIGIIFQDADNQIIASTVLAEVSFGPMNLKLPMEEVKCRVEEALSYMNLTEYKDRPPHYLSGGEKKRVSIADIIAMKSEILIFDEPTASLDPSNTALLEELLDKLSMEGKTLLVSTHDVDFAYRFADRIIVFHESRKVADGLPLEVFADSRLIKLANLKRPVLMEVYELLVSGHLAEESGVYPKNVGELQKLLKMR